MFDGFSFWEIAVGLIFELLVLTYFVYFVVHLLKEHGIKGTLAGFLGFFMEFLGAALILLFLASLK